MLPILHAALALVLAQPGGTSFEAARDAEPPPEHRERMDGCVSHLESLRLEEAEACYADFYKDLPSSPLADEALYDLALARERQGNRDGALTARATLIEGYPRSPLAPQTTRDLASARTSEGDLLAAAELFARYARTYPRAPGASEDLERAATIYAAFGKHRRARRAHESLIKLFSRTDGPRALTSRVTLPLLIEADGGSAEDVAEAFDAAADHARRYNNTAAAIRADVAKAKWRAGKGAEREARKLYARAVEAYESLDDSALSSTSASTFDAVALAYLELGRARADGIEPIPERASAGTARKILRKNIRAAEASFGILYKALDAGVLVSSGGDLGGYEALANRHKAEVLFLMASIDERILEGVRASKLSARRQASYLEGRMGVTSADELAARAKGRYLRILQDVAAEGRLTSSARAAIERLGVLDPEAFPPIPDMLPAPAHEHEGAQRAGFQELGARPTL
jgi:TolA-binding protein